jgi:hypothetical protein
MKTIKLFVVCLVLVVATTGSAWAGRGHSHGSYSRFSVVVGPYWGPSYYQPFPYYYPPYYPSYYPPVVIERREPPVYIEQQQVVVPPPAAAPTSSWYFCPATNAYYPYVKECRGGWQKVPSLPPGSY